MRSRGKSCKDAVRVELEEDDLVLETAALDLLVCRI